MKCKKCGSEWKSGKIVFECPFCGEKLNNASIKQTAETNAVNTIVKSGSCGNNLHWELDDEGTFTISGTGDLSGWGPDDRAPWFAEKFPRIKKVIIKDGVTAICECAFSYCSLFEISIPRSVLKIECPLFTCSYSLRKINIDKSNRKYDSRNNCNAIIETDTNKLIAGCQDTRIPFGVTCIGIHAFTDVGLYNITIPRSVNRIELGAFDERAETEIHYEGKCDEWRKIRNSCDAQCLMEDNIFFEDQ